MARTPSPIEFNSETVGTMLRIKLGAIDKAMTEHLDGRCEDADQGVHPYCTLDDNDRSLVDLLWSVIEWKASESFIDKNGELDELIDPRFDRIGKHKHECGQRMTGGAVVVEGA